MTISQGGSHERQQLFALFLTPEQPTHRRYEALRAVFVEDEPMQDVAQRFDVSYGTIRNWASEFSRNYEAGETPPFCFSYSRFWNCANRQ